MPTNILALRAAKRRGLSVAQVSDALSTLVAMAWSVGALSGPLLGGILVQATGFRWATTGLGLMIAALPLVLLPCFTPPCGPDEPPVAALLPADALGAIARPQEVPEAGSVQR